MPSELRLGAFLYAAKTPFFALPIYRWTLSSQTAVSPLHVQSDPWPGNAEAGFALLKGQLTLKGRRFKEIGPPWNPAGVALPLLLELHGFDWLRDLRAAGGDAARRRAREITASWIAEHQDWHPLAWHPAAIGRRLSAWLGHYEFFAASADIMFRQDLLESAGHQARHLFRVLPAGLCGSQLMEGIKGLIFASLCLPGGRIWLDRGLQLLDREFHRQLQVDGGHVERCPVSQLRVLRDLIDLRALLLATETAPPEDLQHAVERTAAVLRLFRHGDGGLALFNGGHEEEASSVDTVLHRASPRSKTLMSAPQSGFQRLQAGRSLIVVDAGAPPPPGYDRQAHAGALSFEMSVGRERLIVNCGAFSADPRLTEPARSTVAHSTLTLAGIDSSTLVPGGGLSRQPTNVPCRRQEGEGGTWLDLSHDGYTIPFGLVHHRRLFLADSGEDLRGEDRLEGEGRRSGLPFSLRFHLHPNVKASLLQTGDAVLLRLSKGGGWRLRMRGGKLRLEDSIYLGKLGAPRRCQQIVVEGETQGGRALIKWALRREGSRKG